MVEKRLEPFPCLVIMTSPLWGSVAGIGNSVPGVQEELQDFVPTRHHI